MKKIEDVLKNTTEENQDKVNWTKAWSGKYPVLRQYQNEVDIPKYATEIRKMFNQLQNDYGYSEQDEKGSGRGRQAYFQISVGKR